jgi:hypothetical protein
MTAGFSRLKPGVKRRTHLFFSAFLWTAIGSLLLFRGWSWFTQLIHYRYLLLAGALAAGSLKSHFVLDLVARRAVRRILDFEDGTCLGAVYSLKTWLLVLLMMGSGVVLRNSAVPAMLICFICFTVGWSLLCSSRIAWIAWFTRK